MFITILQFLTVGLRVIKMTSFRCKASRAPAAVLSAGVDRPVLCRTGCSWFSNVLVQMQCPRQTTSSADAQVRGGSVIGASAGPASDDSSYFVLTRLVDDDDDDINSSSPAVSDQPAGLQQPANRYSLPVAMLGLLLYFQF